MRGNPPCQQAPTAEQAGCSFGYRDPKGMNIWEKLSRGVIDVFPRKERVAFAAELGERRCRPTSTLRAAHGEPRRGQGRRSSRDSRAASSSPTLIHQPDLQHFHAASPAVNSHPPRRLPAAKREGSTKDRCLGGFFSFPVVPRKVELAGKNPRLAPVPARCILDSRNHIPASGAHAASAVGQCLWT